MGYSGGWGLLAAAGHRSGLGAVANPPCRGYFAGWGDFRIGTAGPAGWRWARLTGGDRYGSVALLVKDGVNAPDGANLQVRGWMRSDMVLLVDAFLPNRGTDPIYGTPQYVGPTCASAPVDYPWSVGINSAALPSLTPSAPAAPYSGTYEGYVSVSGSVVTFHRDNGTTWSFAPSSSSSAVNWLATQPGGARQSVSVTGTWDPASNSVALTDAVFTATGTRSILPGAGQPETTGTPTGVYYVPGASPELPASVPPEVARQVYAISDLEQQRTAASQAAAQYAPAAGQVGLWAWLGLGAVGLAIVNRRSAR